MYILEVFGEPIIYGGQETFVLNFVDYKNDLNYKVDVVTPYYCSNRHYIESELISHLYSLGLQFAPGKSRANTFKPLFKMIKKQKYDAVHIHSGSISFLAYASIAANIAGVKKIIVHSHSTGYKSLKHSVVRMLYSPILYFFATDYCACSRDAGRWKFSRYISDRRLNVIINGINIGKYKYRSDVRKEIRRELDIPDDCFVVGHVGRFSREKNHDFLIEVFYEFRKKQDNAKLLLIGDGEEREKIEGIIRGYNLDRDVILLGNTLDVFNYYNVMDVFCLPSLFEGFPIVNLEALANGLPTILSKGVPNEAAITKNVTVLTTNNVGIWVRKLLVLASAQVDNNREEKYRELIGKKCDITETVAELKALYKQ